jgi:hypothetical protein
VGKKTKKALIEEAHELGLEVDEDEHYNVILDRVKATQEAGENDPEAFEELEIEPVEAEEESGATCLNHPFRAAVVVDDAGGRANPIPLCKYCAS